MARSLYLTKSRFKIALNCITQLYYTGKRKEYCDQQLDDTFLQALADGGNQVGELAKFYFCNDPIKDRITIDTLNANEALERTQEMLQRPGRVVIAEAAFKFNNLFIRADIIVKDGDTINLYEVKAKSYDPDETNFFSGKEGKVATKWVDYIYDLAFQKYVIENADAGTNYRVKAHLMLIDKSKTSSIEGLNQLFKITKDGERSFVEVKSGITQQDLGNSLLVPIDLNQACYDIINTWPVPTDYKEGISFAEFVNEAAKIYDNNERVFTTVGSKCKGCNFFKTSKDPLMMKSGFTECWTNKTKLLEKDLEEPMVFELWNGFAGNISYPEHLIKMNKYFLREVEEADVSPKNTKPKKGENESIGLTNLERRMMQVNYVKNSTKSNYFDKDGMKREMEKWEGHYPLNMIDFETSAVALPFHKGAKPYEGIAFQFSHHIIDEHWNIEHKTQYISFEQGVFPNFEFVRELKNALSSNNGKVFRYHNHENSYLGMIHHQLETYPDAPSDKEELMAFIKSITHSGKDVANKWCGERDMIDLYLLALRYYYAPSSKGKNGLKFILPAIINDSEFLRNKYGSAGIYGKDLAVKSLNFEDHIWIKENLNNNPYKTLPKVFEEYDPEVLDSLVKDMEHLADGGAALTAYNYLQYSYLPTNQRESIKSALLRYCELDTMAMVMILEGWKNMIDK